MSQVGRKSARMGRLMWIRLLLSVALLSVAVITGGSASFSARVEGANDETVTVEASVSEEITASDLFGNPCQSPIQSGQREQAVQGETPVRSDALGGDIQPIRAIEDPYPSFNGVAVDPDNNLVMLSDTNRKSLLVYDRNSRSRAGEETRPLRQMIGPKTLIGFIAGVVFDATAREIFAVNNDIEDTLMVFSYEDSGNVKPRRVLSVPHGAWGISMSKARNEFSISIQDGSNNAVVTYGRSASGFDPPVRVLQGKNTGLADPHGIHVDDLHNEMMVTNWGSWNVTLGRYTTSTRDPIELPGGSFREPSIAIYETTAAGDTKPLRVIQGPATQLNWPTGIDFDPAADEIIVANNADDSVLFFHRTDGGNVKPFRRIKGDRTGIDRPMAVAIDKKNGELWVANFGDHTALVFGLKDSGNVAPKRIIRNAPKGTPTAGFGNPITLAYDSKRDELLVPN